MRNKKSRGLFDDHFRLEKISKLKDPLEKLNRYINWEDFRSIIDQAFRETEPSLGGRPPFDRVMMFKVLVLQKMYNLSDDKTEYQILDRFSFSRFLGIDLCDAVPDAKTIWHFREQLKNHSIFDRLFEFLREKIEKAHLIMNDGSIVDARIIEVPKQRNSRDENGQLKNDQIPEDWKDNPNKLRQKDTDCTGRKSSFSCSSFTPVSLAYSVSRLNDAAGSDRRSFLILARAASLVGQSCPMKRCRVSC